MRDYLEIYDSISEAPNHRPNRALVDFLRSIDDEALSELLFVT